MLLSIGTAADRASLTEACALHVVQNGYFGFDVLVSCFHTSSPEVIVFGGLVCSRFDDPVFVVRRGLMH